MYNLNFKSIKWPKRQYYVNYFKVLMVKRFVESTKVDKLKIRKYDEYNFIIKTNVLPLFWNENYCLQ